jgi:hypothetical protein
MNGTNLRAYHCTRLLPHEDDRVHAEGLRALDEELVRTRICPAPAGRVPHPLRGQLVSEGPVRHK